MSTCRQSSLWLDELMVRQTEILDKCCTQLYRLKLSITYVQMYGLSQAAL